MQIKTDTPRYLHFLTRFWRSWLGVTLLLLSITVIAAQGPQKARDQQQPIDLSGDWDGITIKQSGQSVLVYAGAKEIFHGTLTGQKLTGEFVLPTTEHGKKCTGADELWWEAKLTVSQNGNTQIIRGEQFKNWKSDAETCGNIQYFWDTLPAIFTKTKAFQMVDPACSAPTKCNGDFLKDTGGKVSLDETKLLNSTVERSGVVADGVTQLLLRVKGSESVTFTLPSVSCEFGTLEKLDGSSISCSSLTVEPSKVGESSYVFAVYRAPLNFPEGGMGIVFLEAKNSAGTVIDTKQLQLQRPPVMLVHGLWDKPGSWNGVFTPALKKAGYNVYLVDHASGRYPSTGTFDPLFTCQETSGSSCINSALPQLIKETKRAIDDLRAKSIAATQVDVVGHSMGGLIARAVVKTTNYGYQYKRLDNQQQGDFHKLITIGTPHQGTRLADVLVNGKCRVRRVCKFSEKDIDIPIDALTGKPYSDSECQPQTLETRMSGLGKPLGPAVYGLQTGSTAIKNIGDTPVPSHAIVGIAPNISILERFFNGLIQVYKVITMEEGYTEIDDILGGNANHDTIVPAESQRGGLSGSATTTFQNVDHLGEVGGLGGSEPSIGLNAVTPQIADKVVGLLQESPNSSSFGYFSALPSNAGKSNSDFVDGCKSTETLKKGERTVRDAQQIDDMIYLPEGTYYSDAVITFEPMPETRVNPGQTIQIRLDIANGKPQEGAMISIGDSLLVVEGNPPYLFDYTVPKDRFGKVDISVQTFNSDLETETYAVESSVIVNFPYLGIGSLVKDGTIQSSPGATFLGGAALEYDTFLREKVVTTDQTFEVRGSILPPPEHATIEESVLLAVVFYLKEGFLKVDGASSENCNPALADSADKGGYYTIKYDSPEFKFDLWDGKMENLSLLYDMYFSLNFQSFLEPLENGVPLFKGQFEPGHACFYFGYGLRDGTVVFNGEQTVNVRIKP